MTLGHTCILGCLFGIATTESHSALFSVWHSQYIFLPKMTTNISLMSFYSLTCHNPCCTWNDIYRSDSQSHHHDRHLFLLSIQSQFSELLWGIAFIIRTLKWQMTNVYKVKQNRSKVSAVFIKVDFKTFLKTFLSKENVKKKSEGKTTQYVLYM